VKLETREWIEKSLEFRLGRFTDRPFYIDREAFAVAKPQADSLVLFDAGGNSIVSCGALPDVMHYRDERWVLRRANYSNGINNQARRCVNFFAFVQRLGCKADYLIDFADARDIDYRELYGTLCEFPVIQYARRVGRDDIVLMPLPFWYMGIGSPNLPSGLLADVSWEEKRPKAIWRGVLSGIEESSKAHAKTIIDGVISVNSSDHLEPLIARLKSIPRFRLVYDHKGRSYCDVGIVDKADCQSMQSMGAKIYANLLAPSVSRADQLRYKYLIAVEGNDAATSVGWMFASNSLVLMPVPNWETILYFGLKPWEHYVPISQRFEDLEEKIEWCRDNDKICQEIVKNANAHFSRQIDQELRNLTDYLTIERYEANFSCFGRNKHISFSNETLEY
jgi:hypothetical protein